MPFTFAHPAIILPLHRFFRRWVSLTALIIGSIIPDFEYFIRMSSNRSYSHTLSGMFWFDLPLGILVCFIYHNLVRNTFISQLPYVLHSRLSNFKRFSWNKYFQKNWLIVIISMLIGTFSHLVWDHFTHERGYVLQLYNFFNQDINDTVLPVPEYTTLQVISSIAGVLIVMVAILQLPVTDKIKRPFYFNYWIYAGIIMAVIMALRLYTGLRIRDTYNLIINLISSLFIALIIISIFLRRQYYR